MLQATRNPPIVCQPARTKSMQPFEHSGQEVAAFRRELRKRPY